jgi:hypothetical protein
LILINISLSTVTIDGSKLLEVKYKENTSKNVSTLLDFADDVDAGVEVKNNLVVGQVGRLKLSREREVIASVELKL